MTPIQRIVLLVVSLVLLGATLELIRKRRLREEYAVLWICTAGMLLVFVALPNLLFRLATWLSLDHSVLMTFVCFLFLAAIVLHYSAVISRHSEREKALSQKVAMLCDDLARLRAEIDDLRTPKREVKP